MRHVITIAMLVGLGGCVANPAMPAPATPHHKPVVHDDDDSHPILIAAAVALLAGLVVLDLASDSARTGHLPM